MDNFESEYAIRPYKECEDCPYGFPILKESVFYSKYNVFCLRFEGNPCPHDERSEQDESSFRRR